MVQLGLVRALAGLFAALATTGAASFIYRFTSWNDDVRSNLAVAGVAALISAVATDSGIEKAQPAD